MRTIQDFLTHYRRQRAWTRKLVEAVPEDRFDWSPGQGGFSAGDLVRHLIQAEVFWVRLLVKAAHAEAFDPFGLEGDGAARLKAFRPRNLEASHDARWGTTFAECLERWRAVQERSEQELSRIADEQLLTVETDHPLTRLHAPLWELLLVMVEHEAHHRGQLSAYLKVLGVEQPSDLWT